MHPTVNSRPITILLVDDDPDGRMLVRDIIAAVSSCAEVREAADGPEALAYLREGARAGCPRPDLIYLDMEMPGLNGQEVLKTIRADAALADVPVVMLTGLDDEAQRAEAFRNGASGYVVKPLEPARLLAAVTGSVNRWMKLRGPAIPGEAAPGTSSIDPGND